MERPDWADNETWALKAMRCPHEEAEKAIDCVHCVTDLVRKAYNRGELKLKECVP